MQGNFTFIQFGSTQKKMRLLLLHPLLFLGEQFDSISKGTLAPVDRFLQNLESLAALEEAHSLFLGVSLKRLPANQQALLQLLQALGLLSKSQLIFLSLPATMI